MVLRTFLTLLFLVLLPGCSSVGPGYLTEQFFGQVKIQWSGVPNEKVLNDPKVADEVKHKILLVGEYKKFFYHYFNERPTDIYSKTTMLDNKAVSYLVIATAHNKIESHEFKFPFVGRFPYIGFFNLDSAKNFAKKLEKNEDLVTWIRPVYAYSTLGFLEDRILSSFFNYDDVQLAELVFHELFHTIFFIKNEVDLNENLANLYGKELLKEYFKDRPELNDYIETQEKIKKRNARIVELIDILSEEFKKLGGFLTNAKADEFTRRFIDEVFRPEIASYCQRIGLHPEDCRMKDDWNQAAFAAFMTYEEEQDFLTELKAQLGLDSRKFLAWLREEHKVYNKEDKFDNFTEHLKSKASGHATVTAD